MRVADFDYELPTELIAHYPLPERSASRLLCVDRATGALTDRVFTDLVELLRPGDLLVFNNTKVIPARIFGRKATGGKLEVLVERLVDRRRLLVHVRASKSPKVGSHVELAGRQAEVIARHDDLFELSFAGDEDVLTWLERVGEMPLPPYIDRAPEQSDTLRYQTVYAKYPGAVAAPTAGLHFDEALLGKLADMGVQQCYLTLHVGAGTFQPVRVEALADHKMHHEYIKVPAEICERVQATKATGGRVIAVGTTSVRALEAAANQPGGLQPFCGDTDIFITPGYEFRVIDAMITNFHLPKSTLMMLVSAFAGHELIMAAYRHAVDAKFRFYSYGDAMFLQELLCNLK